VSSIIPAKTNEVLVKVHAVSLNVRNILVHGLNAFKLNYSTVICSSRTEHICLRGSQYLMNRLYHSWCCLSSPIDQVIPCSDMAGEIIALGEDVKDWKVGDRVCANFSPDHLYGDTTPATIDTSLGGQAHGVLTQYRTFPAHVCICLLTFTCFTTDKFQSLVEVPGHYSYEEASTLPYVFFRLHLVSYISMGIQMCCSDCI